MNVTIAHAALTADSSPDDQDVLIQAAAVERALRQLGHRVAVLACGLDLEKARDDLCRSKPDLVFNLVESLDGAGRLIGHFPALLDSMGMAYTGACTEALLLTSNKVLAKAWLKAAGLPTPLWVGSFPGAGAPRKDAGPADGPVSRWIIKSVWEHASIGLDEASLVETQDRTVLAARMKRQAPRLGGCCFAEAFIDGREFNLSILDSPDGPILLPPAEILFEGYKDGKARIVDYRAKWDDSSYEYHHTPRSFSFPLSDNPLLDRLKSLAGRCWEIFGLKGYARVDFRVDHFDQPWILEVNANPCLSPDAGYAAALSEAGVSFESAVARVIASAACRE